MPVVECEGCSPPSSQIFGEYLLDPQCCHDCTASRLMFRKNPFCSHHRAKEVELILQDCLRHPLAKADNVVNGLDDPYVLSLSERSRTPLGRYSIFRAPMPEPRICVIIPTVYGLFVRADIVGLLDPVEDPGFTSMRHLKPVSLVAATSASTDSAKEVESRVGPNKPIGALMRVRSSSRKPAFCSSSSRRSWVLLLPSAPM